jgi:hypothetical protein
MILDDGLSGGLRLIDLLDEYSRRFETQGVDSALKERIATASAKESDADVFRRVSAAAWDKYSCIDVELMIALLRRWLVIAPDSMEARQALGSYLLAHGPDWDTEANELIQRTIAERQSLSEDDRETIC